MFTGLVEGTGSVVSRIVGGVPGGGTRLVINVGAEIARGVAIGDSISTNGCCLTVVEIAGENGVLLSFDLLAETEAVTNLKALREGSAVNLERSLRADARLGGHFVTGHVDATGTVISFARVGQDDELRIAVPNVAGGGNGTRYLVPKGCIAVDGISLTVAEVGPDYFTVWIIPHTRAVTALRERKPGDEINLEFDLIAKYTEKILAARPANR